MKRSCKAEQEILVYITGMENSSSDSDHNRCRMWNSVFGKTAGGSKI